MGITGIPDRPLWTKSRQKPIRTMEFDVDHVELRSAPTRVRKLLWTGLGLTLIDEVEALVR